MKWIHDNVEYIPGTTTSATSAYDTVTQCAGVCRDFADDFHALTELELGETAISLDISKE